MKFSVGNLLIIGWKTMILRKPTTKLPQTMALDIRCYYDNVIKTLFSEASADDAGREGLKSLELLIAIYLSAREGRRIVLPLKY